MLWLAEFQIVIVCSTPGIIILSVYDHYVVAPPAEATRTRPYEQIFT